MKNILLTLLLILSLNHVYGQSNINIKIKVLKEDSTLEIVNGDTSFIFNVHVVSISENTIASVRLVFKNLIGTQWTTVKDTSYYWNQVSNTKHVNLPFKICKPNTNNFKLCLGRFYYSSRHRFSVTVNSNNSVLTKDFEF